MISEREMIARLRSPSERLRVREFLSGDGTSISDIMERDRLIKLVEDAVGIIDNAIPIVSHTGSDTVYGQMVFRKNWETAVAYFKQRYEQLIKGKL